MLFINRIGKDNELLLNVRETERKRQSFLVKETTTMQNCL